MIQKILLCDCRSIYDEEVIYQIIKDVTGNTNLLLEKEKDIEWHINTKYYNATVSFEIKFHTSLKASDYIFNYPAIIFLTEGEHINLINDIWEKFSKSSDIRLLICCESEKSSKVQDWCLKNYFELIELNEFQSDDALDDEVWGIRRIKSALEAHDWCNLVSDSASEDEHEVDSFEKLLEQLGDMKTKISNTNEADRHRLAEEVTLKFWRAMGGSESELKDL